MSKSNQLLQITNGIWLIEPSVIPSFAPTLKQIFERDIELLCREAKSPAVMLIGVDGSVDLAPETGMGSTGNAAGSIAVVSVTGVIMKYDNCGDAGTQSLGELVQKLNANQSICAIVFKMDTPGGSVAGTEDFAKIISECSIPTICYVDGMVASAGYWFASQCNEIYCGNKTDQVGSIGTMCSFADIQPQLEKEGVVFHEIYADASVDKNQDYIQARQKNYDLVKERLNAINDIFISSVTAGRGSKLNSKETLTGKMFMAEDAINVGLVDGIKTFDEVIQRAQELAGAQQSTADNLINNNSNQNTMKLKATWTAIAAFLSSAFPAFKAEDNITEEHLEKMNSELATHSDVVAKLDEANTTIDTLTAERNNLKTEFETFKKGNPGTAESLKPSADEFNEDKSWMTSVDKEKADATARGDYGAKK